MRKIVSLVMVGVLLLLGVVACSSSGSSTPEEEISLYVESEAVTEEAAEETVVESDIDNDADLPITTLVLKVTSPVDESVVNSRTVTVEGKTLPTAIVSINGEMADVDASGAFSARTVVVTGPNFIEIVASTIDGAEISTVLSVICLE